MSVHEWMADAVNALGKMQRYGAARDRATDHEPREVTLTDDEALAVIRVIETIQGAPLFGPIRGGDG